MSALQLALFGKPKPHKDVVKLRPTEMQRVMAKLRKRPPAKSKPKP